MMLLYVAGTDISDKYDEMICLSGWNDVADISDQYDSISRLSCYPVNASDETCQVSLHNFPDIISVPMYIAQ